MMPVDDAADGVILRWPKAHQVAAQPKGRTIRQRLGWLAFPIWLVRLIVEMIGWLAILGMTTMWF
ncbi:hypothetical protein [Tabrizicola fusiformis]|uniref:hypothetical protein n=1 Tax=Tabrizicola sp. SY72 TaxID=2741673 RepID=UPI00157478BA|nr:hypothetical protein [Tabrizicola sp. SY72]NTT87753.1 hypothetical protein [Tabrizicola sp. SY72]